MTYVSKVFVEHPCFKKGEAMGAQRVGPSIATQVSKLLKTSSKWAGLAMDFSYGGCVDWE